MIPWWAPLVVSSLVCMTIGFWLGVLTARARTITLAEAYKRIDRDIEERDTRF